MIDRAYLDIVRDAERIVQYGADGRFAAALRDDGRDARWVMRGQALPRELGAVILFDEAEHLTSAEITSLLRETHAALSPGGLVFLRSAGTPHTLAHIHALARTASFQIAAAGMESSASPAFYLVGRREPAAGGAASDDGSVLWEGEFFTAFSLAAVNRELVRALVNGSHRRVCVLRTEVSNHLNASERERFAGVAERARTAPGDTDIWVRHPWPPYFVRPPARSYVHMQMWEFGSLPTDWVAAKWDIDEVWCPTAYVAAQYREAGFDPARIALVPLGIDPTIFRPDGPAARLPTQKQFRFCYVGGTIERKGIDILLAAYTRAFTASDDVTLIIKDFGAGDIYAGMSYRALIERITQTPGMPEILYIDSTISAETLASIYRSAHAYVHPYRGEGFALPVLEAMACGIAPIVTRGGATDDFVDESVGFGLPATRRMIGRHAHGQDLIGEGWLLEPDVAALVRTMQRVVSERGEREERGLAAAARASAWTWERSGQLAAERIDALDSRAP